MLKYGLDAQFNADTPEGVSAFLALGGNLGDREAIFRNALVSLQKHGFFIEAVSWLYESEPVGCEAGAQTFYNAVVCGHWNDTPEALLKLCKKLEIAAGRPADHPHWHSRTLDLDLILFGDRMLEMPSLVIPHPLAHKRPFVMIPLAEIAPEAFFPNLHKTASALLSSMDTEMGLPHRVKPLSLKTTH